MYKSKNKTNVRLEKANLKQIIEAYLNIYQTIFLRIQTLNCIQFFNKLCNTITQNINKYSQYYKIKYTPSIYISTLMDKLIDKFPYKKILYLDWRQAAIGHLLLFKYYVEKYSYNVYFLISEQGITLKATTAEYLRRAEEEINKFFTAKIQELELSGSSDFYNNIIEDIKEQTQKLKDARDCPYINLVYSQKLRNSCIAMKNHGYTKPYENWQCHQREKKGFCFLIVRPQHRWKQIATNVLELARKRYPTHSKQSSEITWPVEISYEKFIWLYLKPSFKNFKKSLEIKDNKNQLCLTIVIKKDIPEFHDLQKQIQSINYLYASKRPKISHEKSNVSTSKQRKLSKYLENQLKNKKSESNQQKSSKTNLSQGKFLQNSNPKTIILSTLDVERITELIYHQFGLTRLARQVRRKSNQKTNMFLVIGLSDEISQIDTTPLPEIFDISQKQDLLPLSLSQSIPCPQPNLNSPFPIPPTLTILLPKLGRRHSIISLSVPPFSASTFIQLKLQKPLNHPYPQLLSQKLPFIPRYFYYVQNQKYIGLIRCYFHMSFSNAYFGTASNGNTNASSNANSASVSLASSPSHSASPKIYEQLQLISSLITILLELHQKGICIGKQALYDGIFVDGGRVIVQPDQSIGRERQGREGKQMQEDRKKIIKYFKQLIAGLVDGRAKGEIGSFFQNLCQNQKVEREQKDKQRQREKQKEKEGQNQGRMEREETEERQELQERQGDGDLEEFRDFLQGYIEGFSGHIHGFAENS